MKSFKNYLKEQEELEIIQGETEQRNKIVDLIKSIEKFNDAAKELGKDEGEAEQLIYDMLRDYLAKEDASSVPPMDDLGIDAGVEDVEGDSELDFSDDEETDTEDESEENW